MSGERVKPEGQREAPTLADRIEHWLIVVLVVVMAVELVAGLFRGHWMTAFLVISLMGITMAPMIFRVRVPVRLPAEFQIMAIVFVFASLFLGEVRRFYERVWWWDMALHALSGLLLGIVGFLLVYVLNENRRADIYMRPRFVAMFAFLFAVAMGTFWEIFEFAMDGLFGMEMQKAMLGDTSGLSDTMWDLVLDFLGALVVSGFGWWYLSRREESFIQVWVRKFIAKNPGLFRP